MLGVKKKQLKPYEFGYEIQDKDGNKQHRHEHSDADGVRRGSYGYVDANGVYRKVEYIADKNGFRVKEMKSNEPGHDSKSPAANVGYSIGSATNKVAAKSSVDSHLSTPSNTNLIYGLKRPPLRSHWKRHDEKASALIDKVVKKKIETTTESSTKVTKTSESAPNSFIDNPNYKSSSGSPTKREEVNQRPQEYDSILASTPHYYYGSSIRQGVPPQSSGPMHPFVNKYTAHSHMMPTYQDVQRGNYHSSQPVPLVGSGSSLPPYQSPYPVPTMSTSYAPHLQSIQSNEIGQDKPMANVRVPPYQSFEPSRISIPSHRTDHQHGTYMPGDYMHPLQPSRPHTSTPSHLAPSLVPYGLSTPMSIFPSTSQPTSTPVPYLASNPNDIYSRPSSNNAWTTNLDPAKSPISPYMMNMHNPYGPPVTTVLPQFQKANQPFYAKPTYHLPYSLYKSPTEPSFPNKKSMIPSVLYADEPSNDIDIDKYQTEQSPYTLRSGGTSSPIYGQYGARMNYYDATKPVIPSSNTLANYYARRTSTTSTTTETPAVLQGIQNALTVTHGSEAAAKFKNSNLINYDDDLTNELKTSGSSKNSSNAQTVKASASEAKADIDYYMPAHYPSQDQIMLLRTGMRKLLPSASGRKIIITEYGKRKVTKVKDANNHELVKLSSDPSYERKPTDFSDDLDRSKESNKVDDFDDRRSSEQKSTSTSAPSEFSFGNLPKKWHYESPNRIAVAQASSSNDLETVASKSSSKSSASSLSSNSQKNMIPVYKD